MTEANLKIEVRCYGERAMKEIWELTWDESAASSVEYALLLGGIALAVFGSVAILGTVVKGIFERFNSLFPS
jgi:Flp pilus assembly pilin Flp